MELDDKYKDELRNMILTFIQVTGGDVSEQFKKLTDVTEQDVNNCKMFHEIVQRGKQK